MWRLIKSEFKYNWINFSLFLAAIPLLFLVQLRYRDIGASFFSFILLVLMINTWNALQIREKRDFQYIQLPLPIRRLALARILIVLISCAAFVGLFVVLHLAFLRAAPVNTRLFLTILGLVVSVFSLAFMFRDRFLGSKALMRGKVVLVTLLAGTLLLNIMTWMAINQAKRQGSEPPGITRVFEFVEQHSPTASNLNTAIFLAVSLGLAYLTIETFARRRSQIS
jgi:hypothetical protein